MSDGGVFGYMGGGLNCYQAHCWRWGHDFGDDVCKRCGDPVPAETGATTIGPGTMLEVIAAALQTGLSSGDVLTVTDSEGSAMYLTVGEVTRGGRAV